MAFLGGSGASHGLEFTTWLDVSKNVETSTCRTSIINIDFRMKKTDDDGDGNDYGIMVIYDGYGDAIYSDHFTNGGKHLYSIAIGWWKTPSARPLYIRVFDPNFIPSLVDSSNAQVADAEASPLLATYKYDIGIDFTVCATLPLVETLLTTIPADPGPLDHGYLLVGQSSDLDLTVGNNGATPSELFGNCPDASAPHSMVVGGDFGPIAVGATDTCTYHFAPATRGVASEVIAVTSDGGEASIELLGTGVAPVVNVGSSVASAYTRIGTSSDVTIAVTNEGDGNLSGLGDATNLLGAFPAASGDFSGPGASLSLPDGSSTDVVYSFSPSARGASSDSVLASFSNGSTDGANLGVDIPIALAGVGVGPIFSAALAYKPSLDFGDVMAGDFPERSVGIENSTTDEDGGSAALTRLTLRTEITGPDAASFEVRSAPAFLDRGEAEKIVVVPTGIGYGPVSAVLTIYCDEDLPLAETTAICAEVPLEGVILAAPGNLGVAKRVTGVTVAEGLVDVAYAIVVENLGTVDLSDVQVTDDLATTFPAPVTFALQAAPVASGTLVANAAFDGSSDQNLLEAASSTLAAGASATITFTVRIDPGGSTGPFDNTALASAQNPDDVTTTDVSADGVDPDPDLDGDPTNDNAPTSVSVAYVTAHVFEDTDGDGLQSPGEPDLSSIAVDVFDQTPSTDAGGDTPGVVTPAGSVTCDVVEATLPAEFVLTTGNEPDVVTAVAGSTTACGPFGYRLSPPPPPPPLPGVVGVAKQVLSVDDLGGTWQVVFRFTVENLGPVDLTNVQVTDDLATAFPTPMTFVVYAPTATGTLTPNGTFDGAGDLNLLDATASSLLVGATEQIDLVVEIDAHGESGTFHNSALVTADGPDGAVSPDLSIDGADPDPDGDGNPAGAGEGAETAIEIVAPAPGSGPAVIPTVSEWGLMLLSVLLAIAALRAMRAMRAESI